MRQSLSNLATVLALASMSVMDRPMRPMSFEAVSLPLPPTGGFSYLQPKHSRTGQAKARRAATKARNQARHRHHCKRARSGAKGRA